MSPEASLAEAEAARRAQERKHADEQDRVTARLEQLIEENDLAARFREALPGGGRR